MSLESKKTTQSKCGRLYDLKFPFQQQKSLRISHLQILKSTSPPPPIYFINVPFNAYDQGSIGSCTANALCMAFKLQNKSSIVFEPSRLFLYYDSRQRGGILPEEGAFLDDVYNSLKIVGVCSEQKHPYIINNKNIKPSLDAYNNAKYNKIDTWASVTPNPDLSTSIKQVLMVNKIVTIGILVYESFEFSSVSNNGIIQLPNINNENLLGGHAINVIGYDDTKSAFLIINSWGINWGIAHPSNSSGTRGFAFIPYDYINNSNLCIEALFFNNTIIQSPPPPPPPPLPQPLPIPPRHHPRLPRPKPKRKPPKPRKKVVRKPIKKRIIRR